MNTPDLRFDTVQIKKIPSQGGDKERPCWTEQGRGLHRLPVGVGVDPRGWRDSLRTSRTDAFHGEWIERDEVGTESVHGVRLNGC
jgi:hypothetical protein